MNFSRNYNSTLTTLDKIAPGSSVVVSSLTDSDPFLYRKLHAMGVIAGKVMTVDGRAPFGDPISVTILGYRLSLRKSEARQISVTALA